MAVVQLEAMSGTVGIHRGRLGAVCIACGADTAGDLYCGACRTEIERQERGRAAEAAWERLGQALDRQFERSGNGTAERN